MNRSPPSPTTPLFCGEAGVFAPRLVGKIAVAVWEGGPSQDRDRVDYRSEPALARPQGFLRLLALGNVLRERHEELRRSLGAWHQRNVVAYPHHIAVLPPVLLLNLKLSVLSCQQLVD